VPLERRSRRVQPALQPNDPNCVNMADLLNPLEKDGSVPASANEFGSTFAKTYDGKVLMDVGPAWYSTAIFEGKGSVLNAPAGTYGRTHR